MAQSKSDRIALFEGDITTLDVDAIVNAANRALAPGAGVCGAIHRAAGPQLAGACRDLAPCPTGEARITPGFDLKAGHVIHTVGPVWQGGGSQEAELLANCYRNSLELAEHEGLRTIAFPAISTGVYGYPLSEAAQIAVNTTWAWFEGGSEINRVVFAVFDEEALMTYQNIMDGQPCSFANSHSYSHIPTDYDCLAARLPLRNAKNFHEHMGCGHDGTLLYVSR